MTTKPKDMFVSASQIDAHEECNRFWWLQRIMRLKEPPAAHFTFGTVLHGVIERWLLATENGRVPGAPDVVDTWAEGPLKGQRVGDQVELYPEGWERATERDGSFAEVTPIEAKLIKRLVSEAIESGVLVRSNGTQIERKILIPVIEGVQLIGYVDIFRPQDGTRPLPAIEDNKSYGKGSITYLKRVDPKSPNYLGKNQQVRTYAWATSELDGWSGDVTLRHNQFPKFPNQPVTAVSTVLPRAEIVKHGDYLRDVAARMVRTSKIQQWDDVPGPKNTGKCSHWYGKPCPFAEICGRRETPQAYRERVERLTQQAAGTKRLNVPIPQPRKRGATKGQPSVSIFDRAKKQKDAREARKEVAGTEQAREAVKDAPVAINGSASLSANAAVSNAPPWANPECKACKGRGITSKGRACPICDASAKRSGRPTSMMYVFELGDDNRGFAVAREEHHSELEAGGFPLEWAEGEAPAASAAAPAKAAPAPVVEKAPAEAASEPESAAYADDVQYVDAEESAPEPAPAAPAKSPVTRRPRQARAAVRETSPAQQEAVQAQAEAQGASVEAEGSVEAEAKGETRGRKKTGLTLLVGAVQLRGPARPTLTSSEVLARFGAELAVDMGAASYYDLDSFKRRERLAQKVDYIVEQLARTVVVHPGSLGNDDVGSLVRAIMGASEGVEAVYIGAS